MRPDIGRGTHQSLVRGVVKLFERAAENLHPIAPVEPREASKGEIAGGGEVVHGRTTGGEVELRRIKVNGGQVLGRVVAAVCEPRCVLTGIAEVPDVAVRMQAMGLAPREQALKQINLLLEVIEKKIPLTSSKVVGSPGRLILPTCKSVNNYLTTEYLEKPLPCR